MRDPPDNQHRPKVVWADEEDPPQARPGEGSPVLDYARPTPPQRNPGSILLFVPGLFFGPLVLVGILFVLTAITQSEPGIFVFTLVLHTAIAGFLIYKRPSRYFGIGFILAFPLCLLILWSICGRP